MAKVALGKNPRRDPESSRELLLPFSRCQSEGFECPESSSHAKHFVTMRDLHFSSRTMQKRHLGGFPAAGKKSGEVSSLRFPAGKVKVAHGLKVFRTRRTFETLKTFTLAAGKWQK